MTGSRLVSQPFAGGSVSAYRAARRDLREQAAALLGVPVQRVRIAPSRVTLERRWHEHWVAWSQDVADQHEWYVRHCKPDVQLRVVLRL